MNPTIPQSIVDEALEAASSAAAAEWLAEFRNDLESFVSQAVVDSAVIDYRHELPYLKGRSYTAFCDPSGGSRDSMTLAIAHVEDGKRVLDCLRERKPPFSPESVVQELAEVLKDYRLSTVQGDRYAGEWPRERFSEAGITYEPSAKPKSDIYRELLPLLNSGQVELLDNQKLINQLICLERRTGGGGRDSIDHSVGSHDDCINSVAGVLVACGAPLAHWGFIDPSDSEPDDTIDGQRFHAVWTLGSGKILWGPVDW